MIEEHQGEMGHRNFFPSLPSANLTQNPDSATTLLATIPKLTPSSTRVAPSAIFLCNPTTPPPIQQLSATWTPEELGEKVLNNSSKTQAVTPSALWLITYKKPMTQPSQFLISK